MSYAPITDRPLRWGIMATGGIAATFTKDLLLPPASRDSNITHVVAAVASSSSRSRAVDFIQQTGCPPTTTAYGNYHDLVADPSVDIIYVATPHSHHFQNVMLALRARKHVLCEKAFTVNAQQARRLYAEARVQHVFLMEAVWTRFFPLCTQLRALVAKGTIGRVQRVFADVSFADVPETAYGTQHRMVNKHLAGGVLLDLGVYSLTWVFQFCYHGQPGRTAPRVTSVANKYAPTQAEESVSMLLVFGDADGSTPGGATTGIATSALRVAHDPDGRGSAGPAIRIQGTHGEVQVYGPAFRPERFRVVLADPHAAVRDETIRVPAPAHGMFYEADECARCLARGAHESATMPWEESCVIMEVMDEVRHQNGIEFPDVIESSVYEERGILNGWQ